MRAGDRDINAPNHHVAFLFRVHDGFVHAFHGRFKIDNFAFAHSARRRLADAEDFDCAIWPPFAYHDANLRRADFKTHHQITIAHLLSPFLATPPGRPGERVARPDWWNVWALE